MVSPSIVRLFLMANNTGIMGGGLFFFFLYFLIIIIIINNNSSNGNILSLFIIRSLSLACHLLVTLKIILNSN